MHYGNVVVGEVPRALVAVMYDMNDITVCDPCVCIRVRALIQA